MDDLEDFLEGDILGTQISSRQIADFIKLESFAEADNFLRRLRAIDIFAVQRFVDREIESICDRNKSLFGSVVFAYLALTIPLGYLYLFEPGVDFGSFGGLLLFVIVSGHDRGHPKRGKGLEIPHRPDTQGSDLQASNQREPCHFAEQASVSAVRRFRAPNSVVQPTSTGAPAP